MDDFIASNIDESARHITFVDLFEDIALFDILPAPIRNMLANAPVDFPARDVLDDFRRFEAANFWGFKDGRELAHKYASRNMDAFFRSFVRVESYTKAETNGEYKLTRRLRKVPKFR